MAVKIDHVHPNLLLPHPSHTSPFTDAPLRREEATYGPHHAGYIRAEGNMGKSLGFRPGMFHPRAGHKLWNYGSYFKLSQIFGVS